MTPRKSTSSQYAYLVYFNADGHVIGRGKYLTELKMIKGVCEEVRDMLKAGRLPFGDGVTSGSNMAEVGVRIVVRTRLDTNPSEYNTGLVFVE